MSDNITLEARNSTSEPNLATAADKLWEPGFPPGTTVDELSRYRRKQHPTTASLYGSLRPEPGSYKDVKSEYRRKYIDYYHLLGGSCHELQFTREDISPVRTSPPEDTLKLDGARELQSEYNESFIEYPIEAQVKCRPRNAFHLIESDGKTDDEGTEDLQASNVPETTSETKPQEITYRVLRKSHPYRRPTTLKLEGDFYSITEHAERFIRYLLATRPGLARKATTLKLEGEMESKTETREQFVPLDYQQRPPLCKKSTNLHLEGDLTIMTEKQDMYKPHEVKKRPPFTRHNSNLHLEGDLEMLPEYRKEFIDHHFTDRPKPALPVNNLKPNGFYDVKSEVSKPFEQQIHPQIPFLRGGIDDFGVRPRDSGRSTPRLPPSKSDGYLSQDEASDSKTANVTDKRRTRAPNNLYLEGRIDMNPEYRNAYVDYYKDGRSSPSQARSRRVPHTQDHLKSEGKMEIYPEYTCSYVDFPRERPKVRKPEASLSSEGEWDHQTEKREKFISYPNVSKTEKVKREPELKLEGRFECQPEYRKAYIDYLIREKVERKPRPIDNLSRKAFELMTSDDSKSGTQTDSKDAKPKISTRRRDILPVHPPSKPTSGKHIFKPPIKPAKPSSSSTSSVPSSPKPTRPGEKPVMGSSRNRSLSKIETSVFGPKLTVPSPQYGSRSSSRSPSPVQPPKGSHIRSRNVSPVSSNNYDSTSSETQKHRRQKKFDKRVEVENLAYKEPVTPKPPVIEPSSRRKWLRDDSVESNNAAFVVLDREINNNNINKDDKISYQRNIISRESKWMPSWYSPP